MHIEFNPGRPTRTEMSPSAARRAPAAAGSEPASFEQTQALEQKLARTPDTRPEEVERARSLISDVQYPPEEMMNRLASLLAMHIKNQ